MAKPQPYEQKRIADLEHALEVAMQWLLRVHRAKYVLDEDDYATWLAAETFLCNHGVTPDSKQAKALLKRCPEAFHHELEKAVKRSVR